MYHIQSNESNELDSLYYMYELIVQPMDFYFFQRKPMNYCTIRLPTLNKAEYSFSPLKERKVMDFRDDKKDKVIFFWC